MNKPFLSQQGMLRALNLKRWRTIKNYLDTGILFKNFYFYSQELNTKMKEKILLNKSTAEKGNYFYKPTKNSKLIWVYNNKNNLVNNRTFISIHSSSKELNLNRKTIARYLDSGNQFKGFTFYSFPK